MLDPLVAGDIEMNHSHRGGAERPEELGDKVTVNSTHGKKGRVQFAGQIRGLLHAGVLDS